EAEHEDAQQREVEFPDQLHGHPYFFPNGHHHGAGFSGSLALACSALFSVSLAFACTPFFSASFDLVCCRLGSGAAAVGASAALHSGYACPRAVAAVRKAGSASRG